MKISLDSSIVELRCQRKNQWAWRLDWINRNDPIQRLQIKSTEEKWTEYQRQDNDKGPNMC